MSDQKNGKEGRFWESRKFWYAVIAVGAFLALALTGTMTFTEEQTINFLLGLFGINIGAHALTDISSVIGMFFGKGAVAQSVVDEGRVVVVTVDSGIATPVDSDK